MARPPKNEFTLPDGSKVPFSIHLVGNLYRCKFKNSEGKFVAVSTGEANEHEAWSEAARIVLAAYGSPKAKPDPRKATWEQVIQELPTVGNLRPKALESYTSRINVLRELIPGTKGPHDITEDVAKRFRHLYITGTFKKSKKEGAKEYPRSLVTVSTTLRILSCLWNHLIEMGIAKENPFEKLPRPEAPKMVPVAPTEKDIDEFFAWVDAKGWELLSVFLKVKAFIGCRTRDLCQAKSSQWDSKNKVLTITPEDDKTNRERKVPIPTDLAKGLDSIKGITYLWERYTEDAKKFRPGRRNATEFKPSLMYWFIDDIFPAYRKAFPERPHITAHDLRRRAITLMVALSGMDIAAQAIGIHPDTARKHYLDAKQAFDTDEAFKRLAGVLVPKSQEQK